MSAVGARRSTPARRAGAIGVAVAIDWLVGELPTPVHPVGWVGFAANYLARRAPKEPAARLRYGILAPGAVLAAAGALGFAIERAGRRTPMLAAVALGGAALSTTIALRTLLRRAREVEAELEAGHLETARALVGRHLVSRDTRALEPDEVAGATIESLAENLSDGVVAPLLAYALAGLPGALAYRAANTFDSLWGYRTPEFELLGRHAARLDDALNLLPSRVSAGALVFATALQHGAAEARRALDLWLDEGDFTPSPNAGQPMGAMAGALGVELVKEGAYRLGTEGRPPTTRDLANARRLVTLAAGLVSGALILGLAGRAIAEERA